MLMAVDKKGLEVPQSKMKKHCFLYATKTVRNAYLVVPSSMICLQTVSLRTLDTHLQSHG